MTNAPVPPFSLDSEEHVLGAMLLSQGAIEACLDINSGRDFYRASHGEIFKAILSLYAKGQPVDATLVIEELTRGGNLEDAGGADRIHELAALVPSVSNAAHHANIVRETWLARGLISAGNEIARLGRERPGSIEELVAQADEQMLTVQGFMERKNDSVFTGKELVEQFRHRIANPEDERTGVTPPFSFLPPLSGGRLYVLGGYQADGKSSLAFQFLASGCQGGARVGFHSLEMGRADVMDRLVCSFGLDYHDVRTGRIPQRHQEQLEEALKEVGEWDWELIDDEAIDPTAIRRSQRRGKYDLLIIDHLHRIPIKDKRHAREELEENVRRITNIAREFDIPILLLAQLSRGDKRDPFPRPTMADLRGSGMIEAEAAAVWFVWRLRDQMNAPTTDAELIVAKNRYGGLGARNLHFRASQVRFTEAASI